MKHTQWNEELKNTLLTCVTDEGVDPTLDERLEHLQEIAESRTDDDAAWGYSLVEIIGFRAMFLLDASKYEEARALYSQSAKLNERIIEGHSRSTVCALLGSAQAAYELGDEDAARSLVSRVLTEYGAYAFEFAACGLTDLLEKLKPIAKDKD